MNVQLQHAQWAIEEFKVWNWKKPSTSFDIHCGIKSRCLQTWLNAMLLDWGVLGFESRAINERFSLLASISTIFRGHWPLLRRHHTFNSYLWGIITVLASAQKYGGQDEFSARKGEPSTSYFVSPITQPPYPGLSPQHSFDTYATSPQIVVCSAPPTACSQGWCVRYTGSIRSSVAHGCSRHQDRDRGFFVGNQFDRGVCDCSHLEVSQFAVGGMRRVSKKGVAYRRKWRYCTWLPCVFLHWYWA